MFKNEVLFSPLLHLIIELAFNRYLVVEFMCVVKKNRGPSCFFFKLLNLKPINKMVYLNT